LGPSKVKTPTELPPEPFTLRPTCQVLAPVEVPLVCQTLASMVVTDAAVLPPSRKVLPLVLLKTSWSPPIFPFTTMVAGAPLLPSCQNLALLFAAKLLLKTAVLPSVINNVPEVFKNIEA